MAGICRARLRSVAVAICCLVCAAPGVLPVSLAAQQDVLHALDTFPMRQDGPVLRQAVQAGEPFTVAGPRGVIVGQQQGAAEVWLLPVKLLSHLSLEAEVDGYPVPLDLNAMAREIEVRPDRTTITYSHIAVTVRQIMFAPEQTAESNGVVVLFAIDAVRPVKLTLSFTPEMREMWPMPSSGTPNAEWVQRGASGFYMLSTDAASLTGAVALPGATPGIMAPFQERPQTHPLQLILRFDPAHDSGKLYPLLMAVGTTPQTGNRAALEANLAAFDARLPALYAEHAAAVVAREQAMTEIVTPDAALNADLQWAESSIYQLRARTRPSAAFPSGEVGLVAGYYASGDSARPGFGWYFGRDTLYTIAALDSYGDFATAKSALEFLLRRQRADGKIMHEYSQTAGELDWAKLPYEFASADATPLLLTAVQDYVRSSGDVDFLRAHKAELLLAWKFETTHDADGDGIYDNGQGTGWVESWPGGMPQQEIYMALLDEQASRAMAELAGMMSEASIGAQAASRADQVRATREREYYNAATGLYAFSRNAAGGTGAAQMDQTQTIYPALAWWNGANGLKHPEASLRAWATSAFATDWGARDVSENDPKYDPISYHQGSVWPLFTGWAAMAEYRGGHPMAGYRALMQNAQLTDAQDPGAVTELLSGKFYEPFGRSTSHQLWSSAMVVTPLLRGLFGIEADALDHTLRVTPRLPADWNDAEVQRLHVGESLVDLTYARRGGEMIITARTLRGAKVHFAEGGDVLHAKLPAVEVSMKQQLPPRGSVTAQPRVVAENYQGRSLTLTLEGMAGSEALMRVRTNLAGAVARADGAKLEGDALRVHFNTGIGYSAGGGYVQQVVTLHW
jgi:glycogen debranching enzyme